VSRLKCTCNGVNGQWYEDYFYHKLDKKLVPEDRAEALYYERAAHLRSSLIGGFPAGTGKHLCAL
jgi:hypothetical protein